jgi:hypothetical protein
MSGGWGGPPGKHHNQGNQGWGNQPNQPGWGNQPNQPGQWGNPPGFGSGGGQQSSLFNPNQDYLLITGLNKGMVADVSQGNDRNRLILWSKSGDKNQRFRIRAVGNGKYQIVSCMGGALQIPNGSGANGVQIINSQQMNSPGEMWDIYPAQGHNGGYYIKSFCGKMLDVNQGKDSKGQSIIQYDYNGGKNQVWFIQSI